jgi:hypothetical protein
VSCCKDLEAWVGGECLSNCSGDAALDFRPRTVDAGEALTSCAGGNILEGEFCVDKIVPYGLSAAERDHDELVCLVDSDIASCVCYSRAAAYGELGWGGVTRFRAYVGMPSHMVAPAACTSGQLPTGQVIRAPWAPPSLLGQ